jgi:alkyl hydroperoxide reductase subunit D
MGALEAIRGAVPDVARDVRLNLQAVMDETTLSVDQRWGVAVTAAASSRNARLRRAVIAEAQAAVAPAVVEDALAAAALMAMNNVYYRFKHLVDNASYGDKPARLRMNRLARPATSRLDFELYSLAASAINGCGTCMSAHERVVVAGGLSEDQVHDAVRIAAVVNATAVALEIAMADGVTPGIIDADAAEG